MIMDFLEVLNSFNSLSPVLITYNLFYRGDVYLSIPISRFGLYRDGFYYFFLYLMDTTNLRRVWGACRSYNHSL